MESIKISLDPISREDDVLRVLTFNVGLLRVKWFGRTVFASPPFVTERFTMLLTVLPEFIERHKIDIVALQEIYEQGQVKALLQAVQAQLPHHARVNNQKNIQFHNGLLFLSRTPIDETTLVKHAQASALERTFACKSCLAIRVSTHIGKIALANLHTTAGGGVDPEAGGVDSVRQSELEEAMELCDQAQADGYASAIIGDLNCGPEASAPNYDYVVQSRGYADVVAPFAAEVGATWDQANPLNNLAVFANCPPQRIDHLCFHKDAPFAARRVSKVFTDASVSVIKKKKPLAVTLSDHFGLLIDVVARK